MSSPRRELLRHAEFLRDSGFLYLENELKTPLARPQPAPPASHAQIDSRRRPVAAPMTKPAEAKQQDRVEMSKSPPDIKPSSLAQAEREKLIEEARAEVAGCTRCELCASRAQTVYGVGSPMAKIVFVGEAPGAEEDRTGVPFVGRAGQLLTKMVEAIGFSRDEVYICNTLKCRPPENRDPKPSEKEACRPFLVGQLEILSPQLLVGVGAHAASYLTGLETSLGRMRGRWHEFRGIPVMATYHPAFLLRSPSYKKQAWEDLQMLHARYVELNPDDEREAWKKDGA